MKFRKKLNKINKTEGQIIVESIIALAVITIGFLSLIALMSNAIGLSKVNSEYYIATYLSAEGIEVIKNIIDTNVIAGKSWNDGLATDGTYEVEYNSLSLLPNQNRFYRFLNFDPNSKIYSYSNGQPTRFKRTIEITNINANHIKVKSTVFWTSRGGAQFQVDLEDNFYNSYSLASSPSSPSSPSQSSPPSSPSSPPQTNIDILSYFLRKDLTTYPTTTGNYKYSPTQFTLLARDLSENTTSISTIEFNQFTDEDKNGIFLEKWRDPSQRIYYTYDNDYIYMKYDSTGLFPYSFSDGKWLKRYMNVGDIINVTTNYLKYYTNTSGCVVSSTQPWRYNIKLASSTTDNLPDIGNVDVIIVEYYWDNGNAIEKEYYAKDYGIYKWEEFINGTLKRYAALNSIYNTSTEPPPLPLEPCNYY